MALHLIIIQVEAQMDQIHIMDLLIQQPHQIQVQTHMDHLHILILIQIQVQALLVQILILIQTLQPMDHLVQVLHHIQAQLQILILMIPQALIPIQIHIHI